MGWHGGAVRRRGDGWQGRAFGKCPGGAPPSQRTSGPGRGPAGGWGVLALAHLDLLGHLMRRKRGDVRLVGRCGGAKATSASWAAGPSTTGSRGRGANQRGRWAEGTCTHVCGTAGKGVGGLAPLGRRLAPLGRRLEPMPGLSAVGRPEGNPSSSWMVGGSEAVRLAAWAVSALAPLLGCPSDVTDSPWAVVHVGESVIPAGATKKRSKGVRTLARASPVGPREVDQTVTRALPRAGRRGGNAAAPPKRAQALWGAWQRWACGMVQGRQARA